MLAYDSALAATMRRQNAADVAQSRRWRCGVKICFVDLRQLNNVFLSVVAEWCYCCKHISLLVSKNLKIPVAIVL